MRVRTNTYVYLSVAWSDGIWSDILTCMSNHQMWINWVIAYKCPHVWVNSFAQNFNTWLKKIGSFRQMKASNICSAKPTTFLCLRWRKLLTILFGTKYTVMFDKRYQQVHRTFFTEFKTSNISARWTNQYKSMRWPAGSPCPIAVRTCLRFGFTAMRTTSRAIRWYWRWRKPGR
jgi:hypothetical protein